MTATKTFGISGRVSHRSMKQNRGLRCRPTNTCLTVTDKNAEAPHWMENKHFPQMVLKELDVHRQPGKEGEIST